MEKSILILAIVIMAFGAVHANAVHGGKILYIIYHTMSKVG